jgi:hypothetical protein
MSKCKKSRVVVEFLSQKLAKERTSFLKGSNQELPVSLILKDGYQSGREASIRSMPARRPNT